jgi:hypothetical protein
MKINNQIVGDLIRWGYQPLAVASDTKRPVRSDWQTATFSIDEVLREGSSTFGLRLGDKGLCILEFSPQNSSDPELIFSKTKGAYFKDHLFKGKAITCTSVSGIVHIIYRTDNFLQSKLVSMTDQGKPLFTLKGEGDFIEMEDISKFSGLRDLPLLSAEDERYLLSIAVAFDQSVLGSQSSPDFDSVNNCLAILEASGWRTSAEYDLWYELEPEDQESNDARLTVSKFTNRAFAWSGSASLPANQSMTPSSLTCYLKHRGDWTSFTNSLKPTAEWVESTTSGKGGLFKYENPNDVLLNSNIVLSKPLLGELWQEGELAILFGPTNVGKSILAVEIADAIASGGSALSGRLKSEVGPVKVLYLDFEMKASKFKGRFDGRNFSPNFKRVVLDGGQYNPKTLRTTVIPEIKRFLKESSAKVIIIDNLSFIQADNTKANDAADIIGDFLALRDSEGVSILLISHTTKFPRGIPIEYTNLAGSAFMSHFIDSLFAVNKAAEKTFYIKQLKQRDGAEVYGADNVIHCSIDLTESGLRVKEIGTIEEWKILDRSSEDKSDRNEKIINDYKSGAGSIRDLAARYELSKSTVGEIVKGSLPPEDEPDNLPF